MIAKQIITDNKHQTFQMNIMAKTKINKKIKILSIKKIKINYYIETKQIQRLLSKIKMSKENHS